MSRWLVLFVCSCSARTEQASPPAAPSVAAVVGTWRGTSTCLVRPSACRDETVVYHITQHGDALAAAADKIVDGNEVPMGELSCAWAAETRTVRCAIDKGVFTFVVDGDRMTGRLELSDGTPFRTIDVRRGQ